MFVTTGMWSKECLREAKKFIKPENIIEVCNTQASGYSTLPDPSTWKIDNNASFLHVCMNETVHGFEIKEDEFPWEKFPKDICIIGDLSSNMGTRKIDWNKFSCVYAGAQKNMGPSGSTIVIVKRSLLGKADPDVPVMCDWEKNEKYLNGYYNTPPCWAIYVMALNVSYMNQ
jgi:phosphoserine aminotransferase